MGNLVLYRSRDQQLGDVGKGRWREMRRLLPSFLEYVNSAMLEEWGDGTLRNVLVSWTGAVPTSPPPATPPHGGSFKLDTLLRDESDTVDELYVLDADEYVRLLAWFAFLHSRDGAASLYAPLAVALRECTRGVEAYASDPPNGAS